MKKYYISSLHDSYENNYEKGEGAFCNQWRQEKVVKASNLDEALKFYFHNELYIDYDINNLDVNENEIKTSVLVDTDNCQATEYEIEQWQKNEFTLYTQYVYICVEAMQEINIEEELLIKNK